MPALVNPAPLAIGISHVGPTGCSSNRVGEPALLMNPHGMSLPRPCLRGINPRNEHCLFAPVRCRLRVDGQPAGDEGR